MGLTLFHLLCSSAHCYGHQSREMRHMWTAQKPVALVHLPDISQPSLLLTEKPRIALYSSLLAPHIPDPVLQYIEAWHITCNLIQKKYGLAWPQFAGCWRP